MRTGTSDAALFRMLANGWPFPEYNVPIQIKPRTILDLGANIGVVSIILARSYPQAQIFAVEALPENIELLKANTGEFENIKIIPFGIGPRTEMRRFTKSDDPWNWGGGAVEFSQKGIGADEVTIPVLGVADMIKRYDLHDIDLIKIDIEGGEGIVLRYFPLEILRKVKCIVGELHGNQSELLDYLGKWFVIGRSRVTARIQHFYAVRNDLTN